MWHETPKAKWPPTGGGGRFVVKWWFIGTAALWAIWDIAVFAAIGYRATISCVMWEWSVANPLISFAVAAFLAGLCWHFFVPVSVKDALREDPNWAEREELTGHDDSHE